MTSHAPAPTILLIANSAWNLAHFRAPLIHDLAASGARLVALVPFDGAESRLRDMNVQPIAIDMDRGGLSPAADLSLLRSYRRAFAAIRPDVILAFTIKPNIWGSIAARSAKVPVINNVSGLGTAFIDRPLLKSIVSRLYRFAFAHSATVFFQNEEDRDQFVGERLVRPELAALIPGSGIDLDHFQVTPQRQDNACRFLFIGRLLKDKGLKELAEASHLLKAEGLQFEVMLVGGEDPANRSAVPLPQIEAWQEHGLIRWLGHRDDVRPALADCDCLILPSYREGMPRSVLEASASGRPVIATNVPGCRQAVDDGITGLLCEPRNALSLADAMRRVMAMSPQDRAKMGLRGRRKMEEQFSHAEVVRTYRDAMASALGARLKGA